MLRKREQKTNNSRARDLISKVHVYFERESLNGGPLLPVSQVQNRVADALGISKTTLSRIIEENSGPSGSDKNVLHTSKKKRKRNKPVMGVASFDADAIRRHVYGYFTRNEYPTVSRLLISLREADLFSGSANSLINILKKIGFKYGKTDKRRIVMERYIIKLKRITFLREMNKVTNWDNVIFIGETWLNDTQASNLKVPIGKGGRLIICHAGSAGGGFVNNCLHAFESKSTEKYHVEMDAKNFKKWFLTLLKNIPKKSTIIMDNASYHSVQIDRAPTGAHKKADMVAWLQRNGVEADMSLIKEELVKLVQLNKSAKLRYEIDQLALENGHKVIRTPPYHCQYNAIELIWAQIKGPTLNSHDSVFHNSVQEHGFHHSMQQIDIIQPANTTTTPISLLVQSLVKQLCALLEKDLSRANILYNAICEKLHSMNLIDDSYAMGEFEAMRSQYQRALYQLVTVASGSEIPITLPATWPIVQPSALEWSRYHKEFEELYYIAGGGFGSVFKARHRLDGVEYAVKKVYIKSSDVNSIMSHLSEVKTIASLNHPNIVNYKAAWLEPMIESQVKKKRKYQMDMDSDELTLNSNIISSAYPNIITSFKTHNSKELTKNKSQSDFIISFKNSNSFDNRESSSDELEDSESDEDSMPQDENAVCKLFSDKEYENCSRVNLKWATLYIQMAYCQQTLKQWLDERNNQMSVSRKNSEELPLHQLHHCDSNDSACLDSPISSDMNYPVAWTHIDLLIDMFTQLVRGLHYIHSRGIIHHDIKPSNVFVAQNENGLLVQLGDFGLACPLQQSHSGLALGTHLYAAPEQLDGQCNPKSDMYSLGIILLEMVEPFSTDMERVKTITDLRKGQIPAHLTANYPKIAHIIGKLVQRRPSKRLDTNQLLDELKTLAENKDDTIKSLKEELAAKDDEIAQLKLMLAKLTNKS